MAKAQTPAEETEVEEAPTLAAGDCKKDNCKCLHEYGLIEVTDAEGKVSQVSVQDAKNRLAEAESIKAALEG